MDRQVNNTTRGRTRAIAAMCAFVAASAFLRAQAPPPGSGPIDFRGFVRVIDGDSFEVYINGHQTGIGLIGITVPMGNTACGKAAANYMRTLIGRTGVRLEEDLSLPFDARKRRMYYVKLPDGRSIAVEMARAGFARPTGQGIETSEIAAAHADAGASARGCVAR
jgi:endonuclease YncB( thermonuclease family)